MNEFQKFLDASFPKINISEIDDPESESSRYDLYAEIQEMVAHERKMQRITQKELAKRTGLSQANISNIENGATRPTIDSLQKIADAFGKRLIIRFEESEETQQ